MVLERPSGRASGSGSTVVRCQDAGGPPGPPEPHAPTVVLLHRAVVGAGRNCHGEAPVSCKGLRQFLHLSGATNLITR